MSRISVFILTIALLGVTQAQAGPTRAAATFQTLLAQTKHAHSSKDWKRYRSDSVELARLLNGSPDSLLELARAEARTGDSRAAVRALRAIAAMGVSEADVSTSSDLSELRTRPELQQILRQMSVNTRPISHSRRAFAIPDAGFLPEDLAYNPANGDFLLTSVRESRIVTLAANGRMRTFARAPDGWPMLAIRIDVKHRILWATESALTGFRSVPRQDWGRSVVLEFDLSTARLLHRIEGPRNTQLGDMTLIAIQNGVVPERIVSLTLNPARTRIVTEQIIESGTPDLDPSHGTIVAGSLYFIANSGWNELTPDGSVRRGATLIPAVIMRARL